MAHALGHEFRGAGTANFVPPQAEDTASATSPSRSHRFRRPLGALLATAIVGGLGYAIAENRGPQVVNGRGSVAAANGKPGTGSGEFTNKTGNIDLANPIATPKGTVDFFWNGHNLSIPKLLNPETHTPTAFAASFLNLFAESVSVDQGKDPLEGNSMFVNAGSDPSVRQRLLALNAYFQRGSSAPYGDQLEFYDLASDPAVFKQTLHVNVHGKVYPMIELVSGTLYAQRVSGHEWQDPAARDPQHAIAIKPRGESGNQQEGIGFSYSEENDGAGGQYPNIQSFYFGDKLTSLVGPEPYTS